MKTTIYWENILRKIQDMGITKFLRRSGISTGTVDMWLYHKQKPRLRLALKVFRTLEIDIEVSSFEEFIELIKKNGIAKTSRKSGISLSTIRHWVYYGKEPSIDKALKVLKIIQT